eukprot:Ihof_evm3s367 gene=Ihof_evmTU3s367
MAFVKIASDVTPLNSYLADKSFIEGFAPSQADAVVFGALTAAPEAKFEHALRWYNNIASYGSEMASFPGEKKALSAYGAAAPAAEEDEDDVDLFGSDDEEEDAEKERVKQERLAEYHARKSKKPTLVAKSEIILDVKPWDDETDMKKLEACVRSITADGLLWGGSKLIE